MLWSQGDKIERRLPMARKHCRLVATSHRYLEAFLSLPEHPVGAVVAVSVWVTHRARLYGSFMADKG